MRTCQKLTDKLATLQCCMLAVAASASLLLVPVAHSAVVAFDGGITLWISYDNLDAPGSTIDDIITEADSSATGGNNCTPTNSARSVAGQPDSPPSCPGGTGSCSGRDKITGDLQRLADYIYQATEGAHYLRRVYVSDQGRAWTSADIDWNVGIGSSSSPFGWNNADVQMSLMGSYRTCIHEVAHHEFGHYFYDLPDRYSRTGDGYFKGTIGGGTAFNVDVTIGDANTVMTSNFPHVYVDTTNASITADYDPPGAANVTGAVLTPDLLSDSDTTNNGPDRAHHTFTHPFAQDEWVRIPTIQADLGGVHTEGTFADPGVRPPVDVVFVGDDEPHPGRVLLLDRSGSMSVTTNGVTAAQYVQEAGMFLYHSSDPAEIVGTYLYNAGVEELFSYANYDVANDLPLANFRSASGLTDIAEALERAIDELIAFHGEAGVSGAEIYLMSDGRQTTGDSIWDQVTRANERGIKINTFMFGDADATTMQSIASGSSGSVTTMSELGDAAELKMIMARKFETGRGKTPIFTFKGPIKERINFGSTSATGGQFTVPPKSRGLEFYTFLHTGDASQTLIIQLQSPSGAKFNSPAPNNVAKKGRFNGVEVTKPEIGVWKYLITGVPGKPLPSEPVELAVYASNPELKGNVWFEGFNVAGAVPIRARLNYRYPLTDISVNAKLYSAGILVGTIRLFDDGATGGDEMSADGIYSASLNFSSALGKQVLRKAKTTKLRVEAQFDVSTSSRPARNVQYEPGVTMAIVNKDYERGNVSAFSAWATGVINLSQRNRRPNKPHLVRAGSSLVRAAPGAQGSLLVTVVDARPVASQFRVSLGKDIATRVTALSEPNPKSSRRASLDNSGKKMDLTAQSVKQLITDPTQGLAKTFRIDYVVDKNAAPGSRSLRAQFSDQIMELPESIVISKPEERPTMK